MVHDAVIVGAGPAGSFLAYLLAKAGLKVTVIDREDFPREKVCGGGLSNKSIDLLGFDITPVVERDIRGAQVTYQNKQTIIKDLEQRGGVTVVRSSFDNLLLQKAVQSGAVFLPHCAFLDCASIDDYITINTSRGFMKARYLIGADGVYSRIRTKIFGRKVVNYAPAVEALVYVEPDIIDIFEKRILLDLGGMERGYGWIFPKKDHLNVGVFSIYRSKNIKDELRKFMSYYDFLKNYKSIKYLGHSIPIYNQKNVYQKNRILLIGDAAGLAEAFFGEGIYYALKSAQLAAKAILKSFANGGDIYLYTNYVKEEVGADMYYSLLNARLFFFFQKLSYYRFARNIHISDCFAELITGKLNHRKCFFDTFLTFPYWMFYKKHQFANPLSLKNTCEHIPEGQFDARVLQ